MTEVKYNENRFVLLLRNKCNALSEKISTKCPPFEVEVGTYFRTITDLEMVGDNITGLEDDNNRCSH